ncbi:MAG: MaoC/PaaZ C-terminal domain-containing protein, partial [Myxococcota bacterium]|nr:MaoC/PaaZ C-terminal domain-containing protein [Myxococcota bacterium]
CDGDPRRLARLKVRFSKIVLPGDTLTLRAHHVSRDDSVRSLGLEVTNQRGEKVLTQGVAEIREG